MRANGVELTAYLVNESRARRSELAADRLAREWIPAADRAAVQELWDEFATAVYPHDDLVVALRGRAVYDALAQSLQDDPDTVLLTCGAGFASYPWLLPFPASVEVDLPDITSAKAQRAAELVSANVIDERDVRFVAADLKGAGERRRVVAYARELAAGRPVAYVAEGLVFYLPAEAAQAVTGLGALLPTHSLTVVSYWPHAAAGHRILAAQRAWFRQRKIPEDATYTTQAELAKLLGADFAELDPEQLQRRYLGAIQVPETELIPEYVAVARR